MNPKILRLSVYEVQDVVKGTANFVRMSGSVFKCFYLGFSDGLLLRVERSGFFFGLLGLGHSINSVAVISILAVAKATGRAMRPAPMVSEESRRW